MHYVVDAVDSPTFGTPDEINAAHQDYMDHWSDRLIARGPTLSADGRQHTGSVHVIELDDRAAAEQFAHAEPYAMAGWYDTIMINAAIPCLPGTMWDRPAPTVPGHAARVLATFADQRAPAAQHAERLRVQLDQADTAHLKWLYAGVLISDRTGHGAALIVLLDAKPADAAGQVEAVLASSSTAASSIDVTRWRRGGRGAIEAAQ